MPQIPNDFQPTLTNNNNWSKHLRTYIPPNKLTGYSVNPLKKQVLLVQIFPRVAFWTTSKLALHFCSISNKPSALVDSMAFPALAGKQFCRGFFTLAHLKHCDVSGHTWLLFFVFFPKRTFFSQRLRKTCHMNIRHPPKCVGNTPKQLPW